MDGTVGEVGMPPDASGDLRIFDAGSRDGSMGSCETISADVQIVYGGSTTQKLSDCTAADATYAAGSPAQVTISLHQDSGQVSWTMVVTAAGVVTSMSIMNTAGSSPTAVQGSYMAKQVKGVEFSQLDVATGGIVEGTLNVTLPRTSGGVSAVMSGSFVAPIPL